MLLKGNHLLKMNKKKVTLLVSLIMVIMISISAVVAYIIVPTDKYDYTMTYGEVDCEEVVVAYDVSDAEYPTSIKVKNTGNAKAYIRVKLVAMYRNKIKDHLHWTKPDLGQEYELVLANGWFMDTQKEYIYYPYAIEPNETTPELIESIIMTGGNALAPKDFRITFDVLVSAIQAEPDGRPAEEVWGVTVNNNIIAN